MIRVLHVVGRMNRAGLETMLMNYYRNIDRKRVQFDFLVLSGLKGAYDDEIISLGGRVIYPEKKYNWKKPYPFIRWFENLITNSEYQVLHSHNGGGAILFSTAKKHNMSVVVHSHNTGVKDTSKIRNMLRKISHHMNYKYADAFFACSKEAGEYAFGKKNVTVVRNAIDINKYTYNEEKRFEIRQQLGVGNEVIIGTIGRLTTQKNPEGIIKIFEGLLEKKEECKLLWIGTGELEESIKKKIKEKNLDKKIIMTGAIPNVNEMLQAMDVFILPSLWEGLGIVAIEAQAAGLPTLCSDSVPEEARVSELCCYITLCDYDKWVTEIEACRKLRRGEYNTAEEVREHGYDIQQEAKTLLRLYSEIIMDKL